MNQNHFDECTLALFDECKELLITKGKDYSSETDKLANFKEAELFTSCNRWQAWEIYFFKHIQAIQNYFRGERFPLNEGIHHRIRDAINYLVLLEALLVEEEKDVNSEKPKEVRGPEVYHCHNQEEWNLLQTLRGDDERKKIINQGFTQISWGSEVLSISR